MDKRTSSWHPSEAEVERMVAEMRPLIAELSRRARQSCQGRATSLQSPACDGDRRYDRISRSC